MQKDKSFTIIELLVVIAIIGLISSIILVNIGLPGQKQKARTAKALEFSQSLQSALGTEAVGIWEADEGSGGNVKDRSGFGNNGTISGAIFTTDTPQKVVGSSPGKYALSFDGVNDYADAGSGASLNIGTGDFSVEYWINYQGSTAISQVFGILGKTNSMASTPGFFSGITTYGGNGANFKLLSSITNGIWGTGSLEAGAYISPNTWYHIVLVRAGTTLKHYRNGSSDGSVTSAGISANIDNGLSFNIGRLGTADPKWWKGLIDEVRIYKQALTIGQIQKHYAEGLERHLAIE